jgi:hypothetical protein
VCGSGRRERRGPDQKQSIEAQYLKAECNRQRIVWKAVAPFLPREVVPQSSRMTFDDINLATAENVQFGESKISRYIDI